MSELYWRQLIFDNSKHMSFTIHNYSPVINSEVLIHVQKADASAPDSSSPYMTIPALSYRTDLRTEPGDKIYYTTRNGGEISFFCGEINETHNYDIQTLHQAIVISGEHRITVPEGSMISFQADPKLNTPDAQLIYHIGSEDSDEGKFRLIGAQQVSYTFTKDTDIIFYGNDFHLNVLITASQNVSQLSKEMQDKIDKLVADLHSAMENMATKDMLERVSAKTLRDKYVKLPNTNITNTITTDFFYSKFADTEIEIKNDDIIDVVFQVQALSSDSDVFKDARGTICMTIKYNSDRCEVLDFFSSNPELTKLVEGGTVILTSTSPTEDINTKWQRIKITLNINFELKGVISGNCIPYVKCDTVPLRSETTAVFDSRLDISNNITYENLYQNVVFMEDKHIREILKNVASKSSITNVELFVEDIIKDVNEYSNNRFTISFKNSEYNKLVFSLNNDNAYDVSLKLAKVTYPTLKIKPLKPKTFEVYEDTITGIGYVMNVILLESNPVITSTDPNFVEYKAEFKPVYNRLFDVIEKGLELIKGNKENNTLDTVVVEVIFNE